MFLDMFFKAQNIGEPGLVLALIYGCDWLAQTSRTSRLEPCKESVNSIQHNKFTSQ
jgi:hypothetical protein